MVAIGIADDEPGNPGLFKLIMKWQGHPTAYPVGNGDGDIQQDDRSTAVSLNAQLMFSGLPDSTCADCIFWYQCRQGKVDCQVK